MLLQQQLNHMLLHFKHKCQQQPFPLGFYFSLGRMMLLVGYCFLRYRNACSSIFSQASLMFSPVFALTLTNPYFSSVHNLVTIFCACPDNQFFKSHLFANIMRGTSGSKFYLSQFAQNKRLSADFSEVSEKARKIASEFLKKFLATDRNLSWPEVSHSSTPTFWPRICFSWYLQSTPTVVFMFELKEFSMIRMIIELLPTSESPMMQVFNFLSIYAIILLMLKPKVKLQQQTPLEERGEELTNIYRMISLQEKTLDDILTKYKGDGVEQKSPKEYNERESKTLQARPHIYMLANRKKQNQRYKIHSDSLQLPSIKASSVKHNSKKKSRKLDISKPNPYLSQLLKKEESQKMKQIIEKAYLTEKAQKLRASKSKNKLQKSRKTENQRIPSVSNLVINEPKSNFQSEHLQEKRIQKQIPEPLGYIKSIEGVDQDSSSNGEQVAVSYYQRQFRGLIRSQSLEQTNFLYFSKNESMKDWTENLLLLFEKHDKELALLRKRCKYLQKFDNSFFTFDIFKND